MSFRVWTILILSIIFSCVGQLSANPVNPSLPSCQSLLAELNQRFAALHREKEIAFWQVHMAHPNNDPKKLARAEIAVQDFLVDPQHLALVDHELQRTDLSPFERLGLEGLQRVFAINKAATQESKAAYERIITVEAELRKKRAELKIGYSDPHSGQFVAADPNKMRTLLKSTSDALVREAIFSGLRLYGDEVLKIGLIDVVKARNTFARSLGFSDFYAYKLKGTEGMNKQELFDLLDQLDSVTKAPFESAMQSYVNEFGTDVLNPAHFGYLTRGNLTERVDPYFPASDALERWGRTMHANGIRFHGATIRIDLVQRPAKYNNGFMHGPSAAYRDEQQFWPAEIGFTSLIHPGVVGSGEIAATTLHHEGWHAAHFANGDMPSPTYTFEFPPTSMAMAETQSMFGDDYLSDPLWLLRYAKTADGQSMPSDLIKEIQADKQKKAAVEIRSMMIIPYFEKALYEMSDEDLTPENILRVAKEVEHKLVGGDWVRPTLSLPHLLSSDSTASYQGYILAQMAVYQTQEYFLNKYGYIVDNPKLGQELREAYWKEGNRHSFPFYIEQLTGKPFSAEATTAAVKDSPDRVADEMRLAVALNQIIPVDHGPISLDATIIMEHGGKVITSTENGKTFEEMAREYAQWMKSLTP